MGLEFNYRAEVSGTSPGLAKKRLKRLCNSKEIKALMSANG
jgi:hypothetical protein